MSSIPRCIARGRSSEGIVTNESERDHGRPFGFTGAPQSQTVNNESADKTTAHKGDKQRDVKSWVVRHI